MAGPGVEGASRSIPASAYGRDFFLSPFLEGYAEYREGGLSLVKRRQLEMLDLRPGVSVCEIGYGRGELLLHCARRGASVTGVDYSAAAHEIARETLREHARADLRIGDARELPLPSDAFDRVVSGDLIEHMSFEDATRALSEMHRVAKPGGVVLVHTTPNTWFTRGVYPCLRPWLRRMNPEALALVEQHLEIMRRYHVDEYNLWSLRRVARAASLGRAEVWIDADLTRSFNHWHTRAFAHNPLVRFAASLGRFAPLRSLLGNDLYLRCVKC